MYVARRAAVMVLSISKAGWGRFFGGTDLIWGMYLINGLFVFEFLELFSLTTCLHYTVAGNTF